MMAMSCEKGMKLVDEDEKLVDERLSKQYFDIKLSGIRRCE